MVGITNWQQQVPLPQRYTGANARQLPLVPVPAKEPVSIKGRFLRDAIARHGLRVRDVLDIVETGVGGAEAGTILEGGNRAAVQLRLQRSEREDRERIKDLLITSATGKVIPLGQVATIRRVEGPSEIASENGRLRAFVQANVDPQLHDLGSFVQEVKARVTREIVPRLSRGITVEYAGEYENQLRAAATLRLIIPAVIVIIFLLLTLFHRRAGDAARHIERKVRERPRFAAFK